MVLFLTIKKTIFSFSFLFFISNIFQLSKLLINSFYCFFFSCSVIVVDVESSAVGAAAFKKFKICFGIKHSILSAKRAALNTIN